MTRADRAFYKAQRFLIRCGRVACGLFLGALALWAGSIAWDKLSIPFAQSSLLTLVGGIALGWLAFALVMGAFSTAFGTAPPRPADL